MSGLANRLCGLDIYFNEHMSDRVQFRFPKTKKKRVRKKWSKRSENYKVVPHRKVIIQGRNLYMHPLLKNDFMAAMNGDRRIDDIEVVVVPEYNIHFFEPQIYATPFECERRFEASIPYLSYSPRVLISSDV